VINFFLVYQIIKTKFENNKALLGAAFFWSAPTVMINSSFWGEIDSLYICFLLLCFLFLLKDRPIAAIISFAIMFSIKAQAVFILPFLAILLFKKRIPWKSFFLIPIIYMVMMLPAILAGRSVTSLIFAYLSQGREFAGASMNAANFYFFVGRSSYETSLLIGIPLAALLLLIWALVYGRKTFSVTPNILVLTALISVTLTPFLLPKMHDRYFYPADVFSLILAFFVPGTWFVPIAYQVISLLSYAPFLFALPPQGFIPLAAVINFSMICFLLWKQWTITNEKAP
jgi:Gpi18-like mannosyltransferase